MTRKLTLDEIRAIREERERHQRQTTEFERERLIPIIRSYWVRLATGALDIELEPTSAGICRDCDEWTDERYRYGRVDICLADLIARAKFRAREAA